MSLSLWSPYKVYAEIGFCAVVGGLVATALLMQASTISHQKVVIAQKDKALSDQQAAYATAAASLLEANRKATATTLSNQSESANVAQQAVDRAHADADTRVASSERLRIATAVIAARCGVPAARAASAPASQAASAPGDLLADVQRRIDEAAGGIAGYADLVRPAANQCVADYEAVEDAARSLGALK